MRNDNITAWANGLIATSDKQAEGHLCVVNRETGERQFCCLGWGSAYLVPGLEIHWPEGDDFTAYDEHGLAVGMRDEESVQFGAAAVNGCAPREFIEWLGYTPEPYQQGAPNEWDVYLDIPHDLRVRPQYDKPDDPMDHTSPLFDDALEMLTLTCATLNDEGFTFAQIGDLIRYFGLHAELSPYQVSVDSVGTES